MLKANMWGDLVTGPRKGKLEMQIERQKELGRRRASSSVSNRMAPGEFAELERRAYEHIRQHPPGDISRTVVKASMGTVAPVNAAFERAIKDGLVIIDSKGYSDQRKRFTRTNNGRG